MECDFQFPRQRQKYYEGGGLIFGPQYSEQEKTSTSQTDASHRNGPQW